MMSGGNWLSRALFWLGCGAALGLIVLLIVAPWFAPAVEDEGPGARLLNLFAHDATLRRTTLASALGLLVTACVFFRRQGPDEAPRKTKRPRPPGAVGA